MKAFFYLGDLLLFDGIKSLHQLRIYCSANLKQTIHTQIYIQNLALHL